ncbi:alpha/beta fold hydrolase [Streptomyces sp. ODS28]|uniref:alpha/beta fold hydrolase n=1 Tax=Streptomyces sp. ODS28 TaxID=3136688 RepID=UPI0031E5CA74
MTSALVLVHSPLTGPSVWQPAAGLLRARGHEVAVPSLGEALEGEGPYYPRLAAAAAGQIRDQAPDATHLTLAAHSGAGALLPAVADAARAPVRNAVYVDALLPHPGVSWLATAPDELRSRMRELTRDGALAPWHEWFPRGTVEALVPDAAQRTRFCAELPRVPERYFAEPAPDSRALEPGSCAYLRLSETYEPQAATAERAGWPVRRLRAHHLSLLTSPEATADALEELIAA